MKWLLVVVVLTVLGVALGVPYPYVSTAFRQSYITSVDYGDWYPTLEKVPLMLGGIWPNGLKLLTPNGMIGQSVVNTKYMVSYNYMGIKQGSLFIEHPEGDMTGMIGLPNGDVIISYMSIEYAAQGLRCAVTLLLVDGITLNVHANQTFKSAVQVGYPTSCSHVPLVVQPPSGHASVMLLLPNTTIATFSVKNLAVEGTSDAIIASNMDGSYSLHCMKYHRDKIFFILEKEVIAISAAAPYTKLFSANHSLSPFDYWIAPKCGVDAIYATIGVLRNNVYTDDGVGALSGADGSIMWYVRSDSGHSTAMEVSGQDHILVRGRDFGTEAEITITDYKQGGKDWFWRYPVAVESIYYNLENWTPSPHTSSYTAMDVTSLSKVVPYSADALTGELHKMNITGFSVMEHEVFTTQALAGDVVLAQGKSVGLSHWNRK